MKISNEQKKLIDAVLDQIAEDAHSKDFTAIEEMLVQFSDKSLWANQILEGYLSEEGL